MLSLAASAWRAAICVDDKCSARRRRLEGPTRRPLPPAGGLAGLTILRPAGRPGARHVRPPARSMAAARAARWRPPASLLLQRTTRPCAARLRLHAPPRLARLGGGAPCSGRLSGCSPARAPSCSRAAAAARPSARTLAPVARQTVIHMYDDRGRGPTRRPPVRAARAAAVREGLSGLRGSARSAAAVRLEGPTRRPFRWPSGWVRLYLDPSDCQ